jgi:hypothetical protein
MAAALIWYLLAERPGIAALLKRTRGYILPLCGAALIALAVIWGGYRFSVAEVSFSSLRLPAPELFAGIQQLMNHNDH